MKRTILRYGLLASLTIIGLFGVSRLIFGSEGNYDEQEIFGYTSMVLSMLFVFFGIKHYRDKENGGQLSFGQGMKVGVLIVLIPALAYGIFDVIYILMIDPGFVDKYYQVQMAKMQQTMTPAEFEAAKAEMQSMKEMFSSPFFSFLLMFLTVFVIGIIVTVISSLILRRGERRQVKTAMS